MGMTPATPSANDDAETQSPWRMTSKSPSADIDVDPHLAWEAERQALKPRYDEINAAETAGEVTNDEYTRQHGAIMDIEAELLGKIKTTPARSIEGALCKLEVIDRYETEIGGLRDHEDEDIKARALALETIRRCLAVPGDRQATVDPDHPS